MKTLKLVKRMSMLSLTIMLVPSISWSQWPTFDITKVTTAIQEYTTVAQNQMNLVNSTTSLTSMQQAIGDNVGSLSLFTDAKAEAEKLKEEAQKVQKRAERLNELKKRYEETQATLNNVKEGVQSGIETAQNAYETGKQALDDAQNMANNAISQGQSAISGATSAVTGVVTDATGAVTGAVSGAKNGISNEISSVSGVVSNVRGEVSPTVNNGQISQPIQKADEIFTLNEDEFALDEEVVVSDEFSEGMWEEEEIALEPEAVQIEPTVDISTRRPFVKKTDTTSSTIVEQPVMDMVNPVTTQAVSKEVSSAAVSHRAITNAVEPAVKKSEPSINSAPRVGTRVPFSTQKIKKVTPSATIDKSARVLKTSSLIGSSKVERSSAFAQSTGFKTGTMDSGKFVFSDEIAIKCGLDLHGKSPEDINKMITEEAMQKCLLIWIKGLNEEEQAVKSSWVRLHEKAVSDHVIKDLGAALENKTYAATFDENIVKDLKSKSEGVSTEKDEISFSGNVNSINQEIIIKLMDAMASGLITESFRNIKTMNADYLDIGNE